MAEANRHRVSIHLLISAAVLVSIVILCGCNKRPKEILSEKELVNLMTDMQLAEAYSNMSDHHYDTEERDKMGNAVLLAHGVTRDQLDTTLAWYGRNLDDYSELYKKVDKQLMARRKKLLNVEEVGKMEGDMLWPYTSNGQISNLGISDSWVFSIPSPDLQRGDLIEWSLHLAEAVHMIGVLGVEYDNGTSEAFYNTIIGKKKVDLKLQTDSGLTVKRIYGTLRVKDMNSLPLFADSISLRRMPFDSLEYSMHRSNRKYGVPSRNLPKVQSAKADSEVSEKDSTNARKFDENVKMWDPNEGLNPSRRTRRQPIKAEKPVVRTDMPAMR